MRVNQNYPNKGSDRKISAIRLLRVRKPLVVSLALISLCMIYPQQIVNAKKPNFQKVSNQKRSTQKPGLPKAGTPIPGRPVARYTFMKNTGGEGVLVCDTATGIVKRAQQTQDLPTNGAAGQYVFIEIGRGNIKACNTISGQCYAASILP